MSDENTTAQVQPAAAPVTPAGPSVEELQAKVAELERSREGLLRDKQREVAKRQELESRLQPSAPSAAPQQDVTQDELGKVLTPYLAPVLKETAAIRAQLAEERAKGVLSAKSGKKWEEIEADKDFQAKLTDVATRYGLFGSSDQVVSKAYDIMKLEDLKVEVAERERTAKAASNASMPSGAPPAPVVSGKEYSADEFNKMHWKTFDEMSSKGSFKKQADGTFKYSPRS